MTNRQALLALRGVLLAGVLLLGAGCDTVSPGRATSAGVPHPSTTTHSPSTNPTPGTSASPTTTTPATGPPPTNTTSARWIPKPGTPWQWQLTDPVDTSVNVPIYDVDGTYTATAQIQQLHALGRKVICYVNAGAYENFRPDSSAFPSTVLGSSNGWPGEKWLDIRQLSVLQPIMAARFASCRAKGFDAIEADEVDGYNEDTGFPLTSADQLRYNLMLAALAHQLGLSIGLKNDLGQVPQLVGQFDFAIVEQCFQYQECDQLSPFSKAGKAVFEVEYQLPNSQFCAAANALGFSSMRKNINLDAPRWPC